MSLHMTADDVARLGVTIVSNGYRRSICLVSFLIGLEVALDFLQLKVVRYTGKETQPQPAC